jgi:hypothetical protein
MDGIYIVLLVLEEQREKVRSLNNFRRESANVSVKMRSERDRSR